MTVEVFGPTQPLLSTGAYVFSWEGLLRPVTGTQRLYVEDNTQVVKFRLSLGATAGGQSVLYRLNRNGAPWQTVELPADQPTVVLTPADWMLDAGDFITADIVQVGLGQRPGSNLTAQMQLDAY
jgi:hypothetical protein